MRSLKLRLEAGCCVVAPGSTDSFGDTGPGQLRGVWNAARSHRERCGGFCFAAARTSDAGAGIGEFARESTFVNWR